MEKAIIVGLNTGSDQQFYESLEELKNLALACHIEVVDQLTQNLPSSNKKTYIGKGKVDELKQAVIMHEPDMVIFDDELSPSQIHHLEKKLETNVLDRTVLILNIFSRRAQTTEAKLQVELARAKYLLPRMAGSYTDLSRQRAGTGSKGPGEQKLELDRRIVRKKISQIKYELKKVVQTRRTQRKSRKSNHIPVVALTGYTNSGKSSLMNAIINESTQSNVTHTFEKDMLFATLETKTKLISLNDQKDFLLTDTVGFIRRLPHDLIEAFKSTLEEITEADLLLHVIDASSPNYSSQINTVESVLSEIGANHIPTIYVYNKSDLLEKHPIVHTENHIFISAKNQLNINNLLKTINRSLEQGTSLVTLLIPYEKGDLYTYLKTNKTIISNAFENDGTRIQVRLSKEEMEKFHTYIKKDKGVIKP